MKWGKEKLSFPISLWSSRSSMNPVRALAERFAEKCGPQLPNGCIEWQAFRLPHGYGQIQEGRAGSRKLLAHRAAYELQHGPIPSGMNVLHRCDNPSCVNTEHLFLGTQADNVYDMVSKGRQSWKEKTPWQKLTPNDAVKIVRLRRLGYTHQRIADLFDVSRPLVSTLLAGKLQYSSRSG